MVEIMLIHWYLIFRLQLIDIDKNRKFVLRIPTIGLKKSLESIVIGRGSGAKRYRAREHGLYGHATLHLSLSGPAASV